MAIRLSAPKSEAASLIGFLSRLSASSVVHRLIRCGPWYQVDARLARQVRIRVVRDPPPGLGGVAAGVAG